MPNQIPTQSPVPDTEDIELEQHHVSLLIRAPSARWPPDLISDLEGIRLQIVPVSFGYLHQKLDVARVPR